MVRPRVLRDVVSQGDASVVYHSAKELGDERGAAADSIRDVCGQLVSPFM